MKNESQIRDFIGNTLQYVSVKNCSSFTEELWQNYLSNNAEYHPDFRQDFDYRDFKKICSDVYAGIYEERQNTDFPILVFPTYGEGGSAFSAKPKDVIAGPSTGWLIMDESDLLLFSEEQRDKISNGILNKVPKDIANEIRRRHAKSDNV